MSGCLIFTPLLWIFSDFILSVLDKLSDENAMKIAYFHLFFNITTAIIMTPLIQFLVNGMSNKNSLNKNEKKFSLISNIIHDGKPGDTNFRVQIKNKERNEWFEIQDIHVQKILAESVAVCESYIHFYEMNKDEIL